MAANACPDCGNPPHVGRIDQKVSSNDWEFGIKCFKCGLTVKNFIIDTAEKIWNSKEVKVQPLAMQARKH